MKAGVEDLTACGEVVSQLHTLGVLREDLNRHNFVVDDDGRVHLIDFENAMDHEDFKANVEIGS